MDEEGRTDLRTEICHQLSTVPKVKKTFGGKKAFHEKVIVERSKMYAKCPEQLVLAPLEIAYIFNFVTWIDGKRNIIDPILARIEAKLDELIEVSSTNDMRYNDKFGYLLLIKGVFHKMAGNYKHARTLFEQVYNIRDKFVYETHLPALAAFELGLSYRSANQYETAHDWLMIAKHNFGSHLADCMVNYRADLAMESMKVAQKKVSDTGSKHTIGSFLIRRMSGVDLNHNR